MNLSDNGAIVCRYCFCKRTAIISAAKGRQLPTQGLPDARSFAAREWRPTGHVFWHLHVLPPAGDLLYLIRNKVDY